LSKNKATADRGLGPAFIWGMSVLLLWNREFLSEMPQGSANKQKYIRI
jgi:hypothetical protein